MTYRCHTCGEEHTGLPDLGCDHEQPEPFGIGVCLSHIRPAVGM